MALARHGLNFDVVIGMPDRELAEHTFAWIGKVDDEDTSDALYFLVSELLERYRPQLALQLAEAMHADLDDEQREWEVRSTREYFRRRQAARLIRDTFTDGDD